MSTKFIDYKYFIIFSLLQYSAAMVLKSPKYKFSSRYMKEQSKITVPIHNPYKNRRNLDYNYQDWEEKKPDVYDYLLSSTNQTSTTASDVLTETSREPIFIPEIPTNSTLESSQYTTLFSSSEDYPTLPSTESPPDTSLSIPHTDSTPLSIVSSIATSYETSTATLTPELIPGNITTGTKMTSTALSIDKVGQSIRHELLEAKANLQGGFFTASVYVLLKIIERKDSKDVISLLDGLQGEITRFHSDHILAVFGPTVNLAFTFIALKMATVPVDVVQTQAKHGQQLIENKRTALDVDTNTILDILDTIYAEEELTHIAESLTDIQKFPDASKTAFDVAGEALEAFISQPYRKIEGTETEKILLMVIRNVIEKRMAINENGPARPNFRKNVKSTTNEKIASSVNITEFTKAQLRMKIVWPTLYPEPTTINSYETDYTSYVKDTKIMKRLRDKMIYKKKIKQIKLQEKKDKTKRGQTSTTTTTTTSTVMPQMHKSKYYIRKYGDKNLYKMKISTKKTTKFLWRYYGKVKTIKRFMDFDKFETTKYSLPNNSNGSDDYDDSDEDDNGTDEHRSKDFTRSMVQTTYKFVNRFNTNKNDKSNHMLHNSNNVIDEDTEMKIRDNNEIKSSDSEPRSSDSYYSDSDGTDYGTDAHTSNHVVRPTKLKSVGRSSTNKNDITNHILHKNNVIGEESEMKTQDANEIKRSDSGSKNSDRSYILYNNNSIIENADFMNDIQDFNKVQKSVDKLKSPDNNAEAYFQVYLNDALFHTHNITIDRRSMKKRVNKLRNADSFSDDEAILKSNIYKVFGYSNDFAKQIRTML